MIVGAYPAKCAACEGPLRYRKEPTAALGEVFCCVNPSCGYYGQEHLVPTMVAHRFYAAPKGAAA